MALLAVRAEQLMTSENASLKQVVNDALRRGLHVEAPKPPKPFRVSPHSFGLRPGIDLDKLNQLADDLEIQALGTDTARARKRR